MYVNDNKIHGFHDIVNQVQSLHHFIHRIVSGLPPTNHHRALTHGTVRDPIMELIDDKRNALVHQVVQVRGLPRHFRHHANLKNQKKSFLSVKVMRRMCLEKNHSLTTGDPSYDGNGGSHFSGGHAAAPPLGSTIDPRPGVGENL